MATASDDVSPDECHANAFGSENRATLSLRFHTGTGLSRSIEVLVGIGIMGMFWTPASPINAATFVLALVLTIQANAIATAQTVVPPITVLPHQAPATLEVPIEKFRRSFYQGAEVLGGYYGDTGDKLGGLDFSFQEARVSFGMPLGGLDNLLGLRPYFRATHLNGPTAIDVPETLYETGVTFLNQRTWTPRVTTTLIVSPAVRSDFSTDNDAVRIFGLGLVNWQCHPALKISVGAVYLDREDVSLLPAFGFTWTPTPDFKVDGMIPRPKIAKRLWKDGGAAEGWAYVGAALGGNSWAVTLEDESTDLLTLRDYRLLAGYEVIRAGNRGAFIECGYSFGRSLEYSSDDVERDLDDALFIQASLKF